MKNAVCKLGIVPVRRDAKDSSEMVTQLLYGERCYEVPNSVLSLGNTLNWVEIKTVFDDYSGFVDQKQILVVNEAEPSIYIVMSPILELNGRFLPMGSELRNEDLVPELAENLMISGQLGPANHRLTRQDIVKNSLKLQGSPYLWGGKSVLGIDCSGLTQIVYKVCGFTLPRDSSEQALVGDQVALSNANIGDLAFFSKPGSIKISHVGIVIRNDDKLSVIHASGEVRIDDLTADGIVRDDGMLTHALVGVQDIVSTASTD